MTTSTGYAALAAGEALQSLDFSRREPGTEDIVIDILYCGICHSDIHTVNNDWRNTRYPIVPGHEIVGRVTHAGAGVSKFAVGDIAAIGCFVDSCRSCHFCKEGDEHYCVEGMTGTYNDTERGNGEQSTYGGYSSNYVIDQHYALKVSADVDLAATAPLLCAGITTWSPLRHWKIGPGHRVGVVGLGGLGHMGVKFAKAFGAEVVMFTTSESKVEDAERLGADSVVISTDKAAMRAGNASFDFILDTVSADHPLNNYLRLLKRDGVLCMVGMPETPLSVSPFLTAGRRIVTGSMIGGISETQEMLDYCAANNIVSDIELIGVNDINAAYQRVLKSDVKYRFVIDMGTLKA